jgi:ankyrin repeat protein
LSTLDNLRKSAKRWLKALRDGDGDARARLLRAYPQAAEPPTLRDVQHALARENRHDSWTAMTRAVDAEAAGIAAILDEHPGIFDERELLAGYTEFSDRQWARLIVHISGRAPGPVLETILRTAMRHRAGLSIVNLEDDADPARDQTGGYTPLHAAAANGNDDAIAVLLRHGANPRARDRKHCRTPAGWARDAGHAATADRILDADIDLFDAIDFDRADRIAEILDADPAAIERPFKAYASCGSTDGDQSSPTPDTTPLQWAVRRQKTNAIRILTTRGASASASAPDARRRAERVASFLRYACWDHYVSGKRDHRTHDRAAQRLLAQDPAIARENLYTAIVAGDIDTVTRILAERPEGARERGGARSWTPMLYLTYTRFTHQATLDHAVEIGLMLLDRGADPNDFYMAGDAAYTALTGVAGEGEQDAPRQPYASEMFELLLERGAQPFDVQILYNTHFSGDMLWWLDPVYRHTIDTPRGAAWRDPDWPMFDMGRYGSGARFVIETAIKTRKPELVEWALARGANPNAMPAQDQRFPQHTLHDLALLQQQPDVAEMLARHGATRSTGARDPRDEFLDACFKLDRDRARMLAIAHPEYLRIPHAMFEVARLDRADVLALLLDLGMPLESQDPRGKRALHEAAYYGSLGVAKLLIDRGAEVDPVESTYGNTPIGWATHADQREMIDFLSRYSRDIWNLCVNGCVDRVREILAEDPGLARRDNRLRGTPLWALPDDEAKALQIVDLLLNAGADPSVASEEGLTPADYARRRGMDAVALRIEAASSSGHLPRGTVRGNGRGQRP